MLKVTTSINIFCALILIRYMITRSDIESDNFSIIFSGDDDDCPKLSCPAKRGGSGRRRKKREVEERQDRKKL